MILRKKKVKNACRVIKKYYLCIVFEAKNCFNIKSKRKMKKLVLMLATQYARVVLKQVVVQFYEFEALLLGTPLTAGGDFGAQ